MQQHIRIYILFYSIYALSHNVETDLTCKGHKNLSRPVDIPVFLSRRKEEEEERIKLNLYSKSNWCSIGIWSAFYAFGNLPSIVRLGSIDFDISIGSFRLILFNWHRLAVGVYLLHYLEKNTTGKIDTKLPQNIKTTIRQCNNLEIVIWLICIHYFVPKCFVMTLCDLSCCLFFEIPGRPGNTYSDFIQYTREVVPLSWVPFSLVLWISHPLSVPLKMRVVRYCFCFRRKKGFINSIIFFIPYRQTRGLRPFSTMCRFFLIFGFWPTLQSTSDQSIKSISNKNWSVIVKK